MTSNLAKTFKEFKSYQWDTYTLWTDFIEMYAISISNSVDWAKKSERDERFKEITSKYSNDEIMIFKKLYASLVIDLEENPRDVLGETFMELDLGSDDDGQFFTPDALASVIARGAINKESINKAIDDKGFVTLSDPACGGGVNLIFGFNEIRKLGFNPQQMLLIDAGDRDRKGCFMTYIQLSLLGANAVIRQRDALSSPDIPDDDIWLTPFYILGGWRFRRKYKWQKSDFKTVTDDNGQVSFLVSEVS